MGDSVPCSGDNFLKKLFIRLIQLPRLRGTSVIAPLVLIATAWRITTVAGLILDSPRHIGATLKLPGTHEWQTAEQDSPTMHMVGPYVVLDQQESRGRAQLQATTTRTYKPAARTGRYAAAPATDASTIWRDLYIACANRTDLRGLSPPRFAGEDNRCFGPMEMSFMPPIWKSE